ncbi:hypothetical protein FRB96_007460 [Tulasnella sp. 330]|nr:hypothetical protein FRB96_007460 [Tulasnella sp. 330]KAG8883414.1 hypothetical protein FRB97_006696 [Tulasnella sp. 331]
MSMPQSIFAPAPNTSTFFAPPSSTTTLYSPNQNVSKRKRPADADDSPSSADSSSEEDRWPASSTSITAKRTAHSSPSHPRDGRPVKRIRRELVGGHDDHHTTMGQAGFKNAGMENGFAELSLMPGLDAVTAWSRGLAPQTAVPRAEAHDVKMASRSWYEPEKDRIVVFDLNDSDAESEAGDSQIPHISESTGSSPATAAYSYKDSSGAYAISQKYLDRIPAWPYRRPEVASLIDSARNPGALVLYKTPAFATQYPGVTDEMDDGDNSPGLFASIEEVDDDEDTQMMEIDDTP